MYTTNTGRGPTGPRVRPSPLDLVRMVWTHPRSRQFLTYLSVSVLAIIPDILLFSVLIWSGLVSASLAGALSYLAAMGIHYLLAVHFVFDAKSTTKTRRRLVTEYLASGFVGITMTMAVIHIFTTFFGISALPAKVAGIVASFITVYLLRALVVFRNRMAADTPVDAPAQVASLQVVAGEMRAALTPEQDATDHTRAARNTAIKRTG